MRKIFLVVLFLSVINLPIYLYAEEATKAVEDAVSASQAPVLSAVAPATEESPKSNKQITAIEIKGNKSISTNTIVSKMKARIGATYQEVVISEDLRRLYALGYFSDVKIDTEDYKGGLKVFVTVEERPTISKITFSGILRLPAKDERLKDSLKSKEGQYLDYPSLTEDCRTIQKMYEKIGYSDATVEPKVDITRENNKATVLFAVAENKKVIIRKIIIDGNKVFSDQRILKLLKTKSAWFFNAGVLKEDVLAEDIDRIKAFYNKEGFSDVMVDYNVSVDPKKANWLYVNIKIDEGKRYRVGTIIIAGNSVMKEKDILVKISDCSSGKVFSQDGMKRDIASIQGMYFDKGYISVQVNEAASVNNETSRVDITYNIIENEIAYVDKIKVRGNIKTRDIVIRRELRINPGDRFDGEKLRRSKERLQNLGFFEEVGYDTEDTDVTDKKNLLVDVKETKTGTFSFGGGYSTVDQFVGFLEIEQKNFDWKNWPYFTGAGQDLKVRAAIGSVSNDFNLSFTEPWMFDYPVSFGFDGYRTTHQKDTSVGYGYEQGVTGGDLRLGKEFSDYVRGSAVYRYDKIDIKDVDSSASADLQSQKGQTGISSLTFGLGFDSRNNVFSTTSGDVLSGSLQLAGGPLMGDRDFAKFTGLASHYIPWFRGSNFLLQGRLGLGAPYDDTTSIPIYERFFAGGAYTVRGYHERKLGPVDSSSGDPLGGNALLVGNFEYDYPLFDFLKGALFWDLGNVWGKVSDMSRVKLYSGVGLGVRMKTPIGPITLDYGIPMNKEPGESERGDGKFHFSASHGF
ncbi:MAG: outer membrane protein assembly factor BamA [Candidatus Omnitrophota bacterium]